MQVETLELRTNVIAAYVCGGHADKVPDIASAMQISPSDSSDIGFNMACALLQLGSFTEAEELLQLALRAGASHWDSLLRLRRADEEHGALPGASRVTRLRLACMHQQLASSCRRRRRPSLTLLTWLLTAVKAVRPRLTVIGSYVKSFGRSMDGVSENISKLLLKAGREALLEEDVPEDEAAEELAPLTAQLAYAHGQLGRADEAAAAFQVLLSQAAHSMCYSTLQCPAERPPRGPSACWSAGNRADHALCNVVLTAPHLSGRFSIVFCASLHCGIILCKLGTLLCRIWKPWRVSISQPQLLCATTSRRPRLQLQQPAAPPRRPQLMHSNGWRACISEQTAALLRLSRCACMPGIVA